MISKRMRAAAVIGATATTLMLTSPAQADTVSSNLNVSATVTKACTVTTSPVAFGNIDTRSGSNVDATGGLSVTCTSGTSWSADADVGGGSGATLATRKMTSGSDILNYALYTDSSRSTVWGDGSGTSDTIDSTGTGTVQTITIYGRVPGGQTAAPAGSYADVVAVTVTY